jgi:hypothetical protein
MADSVQIQLDLYIVSVRRVSEFVEREDLSREIEHKFSNRAIIKSISVILCEMKNQEKIQLILKYCRRSFESKRFSAIFWINIISEITFKRSLENILEIINYEYRIFADSESKISFVKAALAGWSHPWLMVFDNYDPRRFQNVRDFVPSRDRSSVLYTNRHANSYRLGSVIDVSGMQEDEAL